MTRKINSKSNAKVGSENRKKSSNQEGQKTISRESRELLRRGEALGGVFIELMTFCTQGAMGLGVCAVAMARALAALRSVAKSEGVEIESLFQGELKAYEELYYKLAEEELRNKN